MITDYAGKPTYPYILTNEFGGAGSVTALKKLPPASKTSLYVGVSGFFNYDLIAVRKPSHVFLVDCNPYTIEVHRTLEAVILKTSDPKSCLTSLMQDIDHRPLSMLYYAEAGSSRAEIFKELSRPTSWLASQEAFAVIQGFYKEKRIDIWQGNLLDPKTIYFLKEKITTSGLTLDTFYLSNCEDSDWEQSGAWQAFDLMASPLMPSIRQALKPLLSPTSYVLVARNADWLAQKIYRPGAYLQGKNVYIFRYRHPIKIQCRFLLYQHQKKLMTLILVVFLGVIVYTHLS